MNFRRTKFILPNLFTFASICAGLYSIHLSTGAQSVSELTLAGWLVVVSMVCDAFDGRVARMTRTESELGIQLDSLADSISFGVAPAFLIYNWGLTEWGAGGFLIACVFAACAVLRLARFNVLSAQGKSVEAKKYFVGLPTPLAAGAIIAVVLGYMSSTGTMTTGANTAVVAVTLVLSALMVSNVPYRTFKDVQLKGGAWLAGGVVAVSAVIASLWVQPYITFAVLMAAYIGLGLAMQLVQVGRTALSSGDSGEPALAEAGDGE